MSSPQAHSAKDSPAGFPWGSAWVSSWALPLSSVRVPLPSTHRVPPAASCTLVNTSSGSPPSGQLSKVVWYQRSWASSSWVIISELPSSGVMV